jgi:hypothetical protein
VKEDFKLQIENFKFAFFNFQFEILRVTRPPWPALTEGGNIGRHTFPLPDKACTQANAGALIVGSFGSDDQSEFGAGGLTSE